MSIPFILQICALVCMVIAAFNLFQNPPSPRVSWGWLGMAFWFLSFMVETIGLHQASSIH